MEKIPYWLLTATVRLEKTKNVRFEILNQSDFGCFHFQEREVGFEKMMSDERGDKSEIGKLIHVGTSGFVVVNYWDFVFFFFFF